jgi:hypothetical protein
MMAPANAHQDVPDESKAVAPDQQAGQPAGDRAVTSQIIRASNAMIVLPEVAPTRDRRLSFSNT